jgi:hypothetical protein
MTREQEIFDSIEKLCDGSGRLAHLRRRFPEKADKLNEMIDGNTEKVKKLTRELQDLMKQKGE